MFDDRSQREPWARRRVRCALLLVAASAAGCATGVDVTDDEFAEICAESSTTCNGGVAGTPTGGVGGSATGIGGATASGGTFAATGGTASGGTTSGSGGSGGTGGVLGTSGSGGTGTSQPLAEGECLPESDVVILYRDRTTGAASTSEPSMVLGVQNTGGVSFDLSALTIRYWFTADGTSNFIPTVDYATLSGPDIKASISVTFGQELGSNYAEMAFASGIGTVGPEGVREVQLRFHADPYQPMDQTNDFSFLSGATAATANRNITPYLSGEQVGGCIPAGS